MKKELVVLILQYNSSNLTMQLLESIERYEADYINSYRFILMDNASKKNDFDKISVEYPWIELVEFDENLGFAKAHNKIMESVDEKWILLLNNDCILINNAITETLRNAENRDCDFATCDIRNEDLTFQNNCSLIPAPLNRVLFNLTGITRFISFTRRYKSRSKVGFITGAFLLVKENSIPDGLLFDEKYFMYTEDLDLMLRFSKKKAKGYRFSSGKCIHLGGKSARKLWDDIEIEKIKRAQALSCMYEHYPKWQVKLMCVLYKIVGKSF